MISQLELIYLFALIPKLCLLFTYIPSKFTLHFCEACNDWNIFARLDDILSTTAYYFFYTIFHIEP